MKILICVENLDVVCLASKKYDKEVTDLFVSLGRWIPNNTGFHRDVWLRCFGVPLHAWDSTTFAKIGGCFGKLVEISKDTLEKRFLEFGCKLRDIDL